MTVLTNVLIQRAEGMKERLFHDFYLELIFRSPSTF